MKALFSSLGQVELHPFNVFENKYQTDYKVQLECQEEEVFKNIIMNNAMKT